MKTQFCFGPFGAIKVVEVETMPGDKVIVATDRALRQLVCQAAGIELDPRLKLSKAELGRQMVEVVVGDPAPAVKVVGD